MKSEDKKRVFLGIPVPEPLSAEFEKLSSSFPAQKGLRWVAGRNLHFTVVFIGEKNLEEIVRISLQLKSLLQDFNRFELEFNNLQLHPKRNPYMVWAKFRSNPEFASLVKKCSEIINPDKKGTPNPVPHVTLARFKNLENPIELNHETGKNSFTVKSLVLWESILKPDGAEYIPFQEFLLKEK